MLIFGLETTFRSVRSDRFRARSGYATLSCIVIIALLVLATWIPSFLLPAKDICLGSLIWWTEKYSLIGLILGANIILTYVLSAAVITTQLLRTNKMDRDERIAATRVVYYLGVSSIIVVSIPPVSCEVSKMAVLTSLTCIGTCYSLLHPDRAQGPHACPPDLPHSWNRPEPKWSPQWHPLPLSPLQL